MPEFEVVRHKSHTTTVFETLDKCILLRVAANQSMRYMLLVTCSPTLGHMSLGHIYLEERIRQTADRPDLSSCLSSCLSLGGEGSTPLVASQPKRG